MSLEEAETKPIGCRFSYAGDRFMVIFNTKTNTGHLARFREFNNNNNNNNQDDIYGAVIMAKPLQEFTRFI